MKRAGNRLGPAGAGAGHRRPTVPQCCGAWPGDGVTGPAGPPFAAVQPLVRPRSAWEEDVMTVTFASWTATAGPSAGLPADCAADLVGDLGDLRAHRDGDMPVDHRSSACGTGA